jgi:hypothetical protein
VRSVGGSGAAAPLQPAVLRRLATALQDAEMTEVAVVAAATAALWEAWQASPPVDAAREAALLAELRAALGWRQPQIPLPSPAEALALLRTCGNPLCTELGGDSEARVQLKACARCGAVAYCCRLGLCRGGRACVWAPAFALTCPSGPALQAVPGGALVGGPQGGVQRGGRGGRRQRQLKRWSRWRRWGCS